MFQPRYTFSSKKLKRKGRTMGNAEFAEGTPFPVIYGFHVQPQNERGLRDVTSGNNRRGESVEKRETKPPARHVSTAMRCHASCPYCWFEGSSLVEKGAMICSNCGERLET
jgi:hypothetical protein